MDTDFERDGVVCLRGALGAEDLGAVEEMFDYAVGHPRPLAKMLFEDGTSRHFLDFANWPAWPRYRAVYENPRILDALGDAWGSEDIWFQFEQVRVKTGGETPRTPWHQDASTMSVFGDQTGVVWITLTPVAEGDALEFVRGSHRWPLFAPPSIAGEPVRDSERLPTTPDIPLAEMYRRIRPGAPMAEGPWPQVRRSA